MSKKSIVAAALLALLAFAIPIEHKYDKLFRFFSLGLIPENLPVSAGYDKKIYFYISDLIALVLLPIGLLAFRTPLRLFFGHPLWIIFLCAVASILVSPFAHYPIPYIRLLQLFTPLVLFSFLSFSLYEQDRDKITKWIWIALVSAGLCQTTIAIVQYFHDAPLGLRLLSESKICSYIDASDGTRWTLDKLFPSPLASHLKMRAAGTLPHANVLGGFLLLSILCTYGLALKSKRSFLLTTLPFQFFAMALSFSRSALFAWFLASSIWFGWMFYQKGWKETRLRLLAIVMIFSVFVTSALLYQQFINRGGIVNYNKDAKGSDDIRIFHQHLALKIIESKPLFGLGYTQFSERAIDYFPKDLNSHARETAPHNIFLFLACEMGLIACAAFLSFIAVLFWRLLHTPPTVEVVTLTSTFIGFLFISCCDFYPILFQQGKLMFFITCGLLTAHLCKRNCTSIENVLKKSPT